MAKAVPIIGAIAPFAGLVFGGFIGFVAVTPALGFVRDGVLH